jgi:hypothetical protein
MSGLMRCVQFHKSWAELARQLSRVGPGKVDRQTIWNWHHRDKIIPAEWAAPLASISSGLTSKEELRPDLFGEPQ